MSDTCGCCTPNAPLTPVAIDNRPGLSAVAYRVGTFGSFREDDARCDRRNAGARGSHNAPERRRHRHVHRSVGGASRRHHVLSGTLRQRGVPAYCAAIRIAAPIGAAAGLPAAPGVAALADLAFTLRCRQDRADSRRAARAERAGAEPAAADLRDPARHQCGCALQPAADLPASRSRSIRSSKARSRRSWTGSTGPSFLASLAANDPVVLFNDGATDPPEEKKIAALTVRDDMVTLSWTKAILGTHWDLGTKVFKHRRTFRLFGYNATRELHAIDGVRRRARRFHLESIEDRFFPASRKRSSISTAVTPIWRSGRSFSSCCRHPRRYFRP